ncbi:3-methyladenine DNA glycosidase [Phaffia rhodozyma]|uniref:3-methyladenine DNA glycosidase n=1 Tax=Phaffia rhodozyma TaxID=264483 RepID=A0A0F7SVF6_PHARH|nr:3-methyladenine DNA glycosidase [Phaffia rhodozyma]
MAPTTRASSVKSLVRLGSQLGSPPSTPPPALKRFKSDRELSTLRGPAKAELAAVISETKTENLDSSSSTVKPGLNEDQSPTAPQTIPATLSFSMQDAKRHLVGSDPRFRIMFEKFPFEDFEKPREENCYKALIGILMGQQLAISAAASIAYKFTRLFFPEQLPEKRQISLESTTRYFPTPNQVLALPEPQIETLKSVGLSGRKAEYILGISEKFVSGELSQDVLLKASDEQLNKTLISIRGVGPWTVDMFSLFILRRPNVLPCGDLAVQKGLLKWVINGQINPNGPINFKQTVSPLPLGSTSQEPGTSDLAAAVAPPTPSTPAGAKQSSLAFETPGSPSPAVKNQPITYPLTPAPELPGTLTIELLKSRLAGKKKAGAYLTPEEMDLLTESWKPYRSIGSWMMWQYLKVE